MPKTFCGLSHLDDQAAAEDDGLLADVVTEREIVGDEHDAEASTLEIGEQIEHVDPGRGVEHADDLVGDQELDVEQESASDQEALKLTAAQLVRVLVQDLSWIEGDRLERGLDLVPPLRPARPGEELALDHREDAVGLEDRVVGAERILEDALDVRRYSFNALPLRVETSLRRS